MAERIGGAGIHNLPHLDPAGTAAEQLLKESTRNLVPIQAAPLSNYEQLKSTGVTLKNSDNLRLEPFGKLSSAQMKTAHLSRVLKRLEISSGKHPFAGVEEKMKPILAQQVLFYQQIASRNSNGRN